MSISGINVGTATTSGLNPGRQQQNANATDPNSAEQQFLNYMKEPPTQRMVDAWLKSHGLTRQELEAMPPDKRAAIEKEMANDLRQQIEKEAANKAASQPKGISIQSGINILV
jgi:hypothetical protein